MEWTEERIELLRSLWTQGCSASEISARLCGVTRNAVIGKAHRLGRERAQSGAATRVAGGARGI